MLAWIVLIGLLLPAPVAVTGLVHDSSGAAVPGAVVLIRTATGAERPVVTGPDGRFTLDTPDAGDVVVIVRAGGFAEQTRRVTGAERSGPLDIELVPAGLNETVTVTATRTERPVGAVAASVNVVDSEQIRQSPAVVADDVLRQTPTFSLFRRTSSLAAHPTTQGVSLRGIGPSGVSRTLVLMDGVPMNDPFGGWVYWTRVPLQGVDRIELVNSSSSSLYGNFAMGGVINVVGTTPARRTLDIATQYGNHQSPKLDVFAGDAWRRASVAFSGSAFTTDGFPIVLAAERGKVDNNASVEFGNFLLRGEFQPSPRLSAFGRLGYFRENRDNGKASTIDGTEEANNTRWTSASAGVRWLLPDGSDLQANVFGDVETFRSNFLAVPAATPLRSIGRMTLNQRVPVTGIGGMAQWTRMLGRWQQVQFGGDWKSTEGESQEDGLDGVTGTTVTLHRVSGATQRSVGAFAQDTITPVSRLTITVAARLDHWSNTDAHNLETNVPSGTPTANNRLLPERDDTVVSPRVSALYRVSDAVSLWGDITTGFRAPTLNELYRQFRVGALLTLANDELGPERLRGGEIGISLAPARRLSIRTTWFDNRVQDPVSNVTITPNTLQQRQNLGRTRIWGVQTEADYRVGSSWRFSGGYLYDRATVEAFDANPVLVGKTLPQVPKHRGSVAVAYSDARYATVALAAQFVGRQFDDDQNARVVPGESAPGLPGYTTFDLSIARAVGPRAELFLGVQNLFDAESVVGTLPTTIGTPRLVNGGVRLRLLAR